MTVEPPEGDGKKLEQIVEEIWQNQDRDYNVRRLVKRLQRIDKNMSGDARDLFARFVPDGDVSRFAEELPATLRGDFAGTMQTLRNEDFLKLCVDYPRAQRHFIVASGVTDTVESEWLIKAGVGKEYKPEDYLQLFVSFVTEHERELEAIQILLARPNEWSADTLNQLREALSRAPEHFTTANLQRAFQATHHKALVDIISMVKRAALESSPLLTAEERVDAAVEQVTAGRELSAEQLKWLDYIRQHLVQNLSIERDDFEVIPVLLDRGGWGRADRVFEGHLADLINDLNRELVAA
jgi:type I restriction enzyme R subunit